MDLWGPGRTTLLVGLLLGLAAVACDDAARNRPDASMADAGAADATVDAAPAEPPALTEPSAPTSPEPVAPPRAPADASLTPCPQGWRTVEPGEQGDVAVCSPWPEAGVASCASNHAHLPGTAGCTRIGSSCPDGTWAEGIPSEADVLYVQAGAAADGDGTQQSPFATLTEALAAASAGQIVALSEGTYEGDWTLPAQVTLWGACPAGTTLRSPDASAEAGVVQIGATGGRITNLRITGARPGVIANGSETSAQIDRVVVAQASHAALRATGGATLITARLSLKDTAAPEGEARAIDMGSEGSVELSGGVITGTPGPAVHVRGGAVQLTDVAVRGSQGPGLRAENTATATLERTVLQSNQRIAVHATGAQTTVAMTDVVIRDTRSNDAQEQGLGVSLEGGAELTGERVLLDRNRQTGASLASGSIATFTDLVLQNTSERERDGEAGRGLWVRGGSTLGVTRALIAHNAETGVLALDAGTAVTLTDVTIRDTQPRQDDDRFGRGLDFASGAQGSVERALLEGNTGAGIFASREDTALELQDVTVRGTRSRPSDGTGGRGLVAELESSVAIRKGLFENNRDVGLAVFGTGTRMTLEDVTVRGTRGRASDDRFGRGLNVQRGGRVEAQRVLFEQNRDVGVHVQDERSLAELDDAVVRGTQPQAADQTGGRGLSVQSGATVRSERMAVEDNHDVGIVGIGAELRASDLTVQNTASAAHSGRSGRGLSLQQGTSATLRNVRVDGNRGAGLVAFGGQTQITLNHAVVQQTGGLEADGTAGRGVVALTGSAITGDVVRAPRNRDVGLLAHGTGSRLILSDVAVEGTRPRACADDGCSDFASGIGAAATAGGRLRLTTFRLADNPLSGGYAGPSGELDLRRGEISANGIGVNLDDSEYDQSRVREQVVYRDNGTPVGTRPLPALQASEGRAPSGAAD